MSDDVILTGGNGEENLVPLRDVAVVVPAYNEESTIKEMIQRIQAISTAWRIVVIDDGSTDGTARVARNAGAEVIRHPYNRGNGASVQTALTSVRSVYLAIVDADGQLPPEELPEMIAKISDADMVVGARTPDSERNIVRDLGNGILCKVASYISGTTIPDLTCGLRVFSRKRCREFLHIYPSRFSFPTTSTLAFLTIGYRVKFHPIKAVRRPQHTQSKINPIQDGMKFLSIIFRVILLFKPWRVFLPASQLVFLVGFAHTIYTVIRNVSLGNDITIPGSFIVTFLTSIIIFCFGLLAQQISELRLHISRQASEEE
jgi:glycosyltransferase involved in cell wall biosynthesis